MVTCKHCTKRAYFNEPGAIKSRIHRMKVLEKVIQHIKTIEITALASVL